MADDSDDEIMSDCIVDDVGDDDVEVDSIYDSQNSSVDSDSDVSDDSSALRRKRLRTLPPSATASAPATGGKFSPHPLLPQVVKFPPHPLLSQLVKFLPHPLLHQVVKFPPHPPLYQVLLVPLHAYVAGQSSSTAGRDLLVKCTSKTLTGKNGKWWSTKPVVRSSSRAPRRNLLPTFNYALPSQRYVNPTPSRCFEDFFTIDILDEFPYTQTPTLP